MGEGEGGQCTFPWLLVKGKESLSFSQEFCPRLWFDGKLYRCIKQQGHREKQIDNDDDGQE